MQLKTYSYAAFGVLLLIGAAIGIAKDKPEIYVVCLVLGFMFLFQGIQKILKKQKH